MNNSKLTNTERQKDRNAFIKRRGDVVVDFDGGCGCGKDVFIV